MTDKPLREDVARTADPALWELTRSPWDRPDWQMVSWSIDARAEHLELIEASLEKADRIIALTQARRSIPSEEGVEGSEARLALGRLEVDFERRLQNMPTGRLTSDSRQDFQLLSRALAPKDGGEGL